MLRQIFFLASLLAVPAVAEPAKLSGPEIAAALTDVTLYAGDKGEIEQAFQKSGQTVYIDHGQYSQGAWSVEADRYCSVWPPGTAKACFDVTRDGDVITFISSWGRHYPMRTKK